MTHLIEIKTISQANSFICESLNFLGQSEPSLRSAAIFHCTLKRLNLGADFSYSFNTTKEVFEYMNRLVQALKDEKKAFTFEGYTDTNEDDFEEEDSKPAHDEGSIEYQAARFINASDKKHFEFEILTTQADRRVQVTNIQNGQSFVFVDVDDLSIYKAVVALAYAVKKEREGNTKQRMLERFTGSL